MDFNFTKKNWVPPIFFVFILNKLFDQIHIINFFLLFSIFMINILVINIPENSLCPVGLLHVDWFLRYVKYKNDFNFTKKIGFPLFFFCFFIQSPTLHQNLLLTFLFWTSFSFPFHQTWMFSSSSYLRQVVLKEQVLLQPVLSHQLLP